MEKLFNIPEIEVKSEKTCNMCLNFHYQNCGGSKIRYCKVLKSNLTYNGMKRARAKDKCDNCLSFKSKK